MASLLTSLVAIAMPALSPTTTITQYHVYEHRIRAKTLPSNPFALFCTVLINATSASRYGSMNVTMFYDGDSEWAWRLSPDAVGEWKFATVCEPGYGLDGHSGSLQSVAAQDGRLGGLIIDPTAPTQLVHESGARYNLVGLEVDWLWAVGLLNGTAAMASVLDGLAALGINHVLVQLYANHTAGPVLPPLQPPRVSPTATIPWESVPSHSWPADQHRFNLAYWHNFEAMLEMFAERRMIAHVMFFVGNKNVLWPSEGSQSDDLYWVTAMARLGAYSSIVLDPSKETGSANSHRSVDYFVGRMRLMRVMNAHRRLLTPHSGFDWTNRCDEAPSLCDVTSAQIHLGNNEGINTIAPLYYPFLEQAGASATAPYIDVEFFYQWGPSDGCHFSCCNACTNYTSTSEAIARQHLDEMRRVMWDHYMAGAAISGACWYHNDLGWDILDPRALTTTASTMLTLRTLRDFWEGIDRRTFVVRAPELCVSQLQPPGAVVHCLLRLDNASRPTAMILHVRSHRPSFALVTTPTPAHNYTYETNKNCWTGKGCEDIDEQGIQSSGHQECEQLCNALDACECFVYHPSDQLCWRRKRCDAGAFVDMVGYRVYTKQTLSVAPAGLWLDPTSTNSTTVPFFATDGLVQQPASFAQDAVLSVAF